MSTSRPRWTPQTKLTASLLLLAFFLYLLFRFSVVIPPFILAVILAYILSPLVNRAHKRLRLPRGLTILLVYLGLLALIGLLPVVVLPPLARQVSGLNVDIQRVLQQIERLMSYQIILLGRVVIDVGSLAEQLSATVRSAFEPFFGRTLGFAVEIISSLVWIIFILVVSFYLIKDGPALRRWMEGLAPEAYRADFQRLRSEINDVWAAFFRGQLLLALVVAVMFTATGFLLGLPFALAMGVLAGLLEFLPSVGHGIWLVIASILAFSAGSIWLPIPNWAFALIVIGLHLVFQQFDLNYLIPRIIGRRVQLPPLVVILGIVAGAAIAGVLGIALAAPTIASARILGRYIFANLLDLDPFAEDSSPPLADAHPALWRFEGRSQPDSPLGPEAE